MPESPTVHFFNVKRLYLQMLHREICQKPPSFRVDQFLKYIPTLHLCVLPFTGPPWFRLLQYHQVLRCLPFPSSMDRPGCRTLEQSEVAEPAHLAVTQGQCEVISRSAEAQPPLLFLPVGHGTEHGQSGAKAGYFKKKKKGLNPRLKDRKGNHS